MTANSNDSALHLWHDAAEQRALLTNAAVVAVSTLSYYALPDAVRSRRLRFFGKAGIVVGLSAYLSHLTIGVLSDVDDATAHPTATEDLADWPEALDDLTGEGSQTDDDAGVTYSFSAQLPEAFKKVPASALVAGGLGLLAGSAALTAWAEKAIYARAERRRRAGVSLAHTRQGIGLAFAAAGLQALGDLADGDR